VRTALPPRPAVEWMGEEATRKKCGGVGLGRVWSGCLGDRRLAALSVRLLLTDGRKASEESQPHNGRGGHLPTAPRRCGLHHPRLPGRSCPELAQGQSSGAPSTTPVETVRTGAAAAMAGHTRISGCPSLDTARGGRRSPSSKHTRHRPRPHQRNGLAVVRELDSRGCRSLATPRHRRRLQPAGVCGSLGTRLPADRRLPPCTPPSPARPPCLQSQKSQERLFRGGGKRGAGDSRGRGAPRGPRQTGTVRAAGQPSWLIRCPMIKQRTAMDGTRRGQEAWREMREGERLVPT